MASRGVVGRTTFSPGTWQKYDSIDWECCAASWCAGRPPADHERDRELPPDACRRASPAWLTIWFERHQGEVEGHHLHDGPEPHHRGADPDAGEARTREIGVSTTRRSPELLESPWLT